MDLVSWLVVIVVIGGGCWWLLWHWKRRITVAGVIPVGHETNPGLERLRKARPGSVWVFWKQDADGHSMPDIFVRGSEFTEADMRQLQGCRVDPFAPTNLNHKQALKAHVIKLLKKLKAGQQLLFTEMVMLRVFRDASPGEFSRLRVNYLAAASTGVGSRETLEGLRALDAAMREIEAGSARFSSQVFNTAAVHRPEGT